MRNIRPLHIKMLQLIDCGNLQHLPFARLATVVIVSIVIALHAPKIHIETKTFLFSIIKSKKHIRKWEKNPPKFQL